MSKDKAKLKNKKQASKSNKHKYNKKRKKSSKKKNSFKAKNAFTSVFPMTLLIIPLTLLALGKLDYSKRELNLYENYIIEDISKYIKNNDKDINSVNFSNNIKQQLLKNIEDKKSGAYTKYMNKKIIRNLNFKINNFENSYILCLGSVLKDEVSKIEANIVIPKNNTAGYVADILNIEMDKNYNEIVEGIGYNHMYYKSLKKAYISNEDSLVLRFLKDENMYLTDKNLDKNFNRFKEEYQNLLNELDLNSFNITEHQDFNKGFKKIYLSSGNKSNFNYKEIVVESYYKTIGGVTTRIDEFGANTLVNVEEKAKYYIYK